MAVGADEKGDRKLSAKILSQFCSPHAKHPPSNTGPLHAGQRRSDPKSRPTIHNRLKARLACAEPFEITWLVHLKRRWASLVMVNSRPMSENHPTRREALLGMAAVPLLEGLWRLRPPLPPFVL